MVIRQEKYDYLNIHQKDIYGLLIPKDCELAAQEIINRQSKLVLLAGPSGSGKTTSAKKLVEEYGGKVPGTMEELVALPGVGRKTANLILGDVFHTPGVVVADTHCIRISGRLGLTDGTKDPVKVEKQLREILPPEESNDFCHRLVLHGRAICTARQAKCGMCPLAPVCDYAAKL